MKLTDNCYVIYGLFTISPWVVNSGFITGSKKTLIIDSGPNFLAAQTIYGYAKNSKLDNELIVINTEPHFDHIGGNCFFKDNGIDIYGHHKINRTQEEFEGLREDYNKTITSPKRKAAGEERLLFLKTRAVSPNIPVDTNFNIDLGDIEVQIILTPGHSPMNLCVYIPSDKTLYCGDTVVDGYIPNLEDSDINGWHDWLKSLEIIEQLDLDIIVPGHGEIIMAKRIKEEIENTKQVINLAIERGKAPTAV